MLRAVETVAPKCADPSPEFCVIAALLVSACKGKPKKIDELLTGMETFVEAQRGLARTARLRGAEYDARVLQCMEEGLVWLQRFAPFAKMLASK